MEQGKKPYSAQAECEYTIGSHIREKASRSAVIFAENEEAAIAAICRELSSRLTGKGKTVIPGTLVGSANETNADEPMY